MLLAEDGAGITPQDALDQSLLRLPGRAILAHELAQRRLQTGLPGL